MGSYISIFNNTRDTYLVKVGPDEAAISIATMAVTVFAVIATLGAAAPLAVTGWATSTVLFITQKLQSEGGFVEIKPGERKQFGKYTLSLWRQAHCIRVRVNPANSEEVLIDNLYMRPIFSGPTDSSSYEHNLQYWINKWGHEGRHTLRLSPETRCLLNH